MAFHFHHHGVALQRRLIMPQSKLNMTQGQKQFRVLRLERQSRPQTFPGQVQVVLTERRVGLANVILGGNYPR